ncbi:hypothetical protein AVEN_72925-1 [Araneus ventricosus]|uniref:Uncharacterized protein n=1 Tax=Araneus ventricosus TaxID=182803 RepID=A0A4Y2GYU5_ARAVE|nr:hypothetical protein AVEN_72925-1 [Araneus ventricosus]
MERCRRIQLFEQHPSPLETTPSGRSLTHQAPVHGKSLVQSMYNPLAFGADVLTVAQGHYNFRFYLKFYFQYNYSALNCGNLRYKDTFNWIIWSASVW